MALQAPQIVMTPLNGAVAGSTGANNGKLVTLPVDVGAHVNTVAEVDLARTTSPINQAATVGGSLQLEVSGDGNGFTPAISTMAGPPTALAITQEGAYHLPITAKAFRYVKVRFIPTSPVTVVGTAQTAAAGGAIPSAAPAAAAFTPDGLYIVTTPINAVNFNVAPWTMSISTTQSIGTQATATVPGGAVPATGGLDICPLPLTQTNNFYYAATVGGTTPFATITPITSAGVINASIAVPALAGAGKDCSWHPTGRFVAFGGTTTPFLVIYAFNPASGTLGGAQAIAPPDVGNVTCCRFSPDGNWLLVAGGTAPYFRVYPVTVTYAADGTPTLALGTALAQQTTIPAAAVIRGAWHPQSNRFVVIGASTAFNEYPLHTNPANSPMFAAGVLGRIGPKVPNGAISQTPVNVRYSPDGSHLVFSYAGVLATLLYPIKDQMTAMGAIQTTIAAGTITTTNDIVFHPSMQYIVQVGATSPFVQVNPWIIAVQMGVAVHGNG